MTRSVDVFTGSWPLGSFGARCQTRYDYPEGSFHAVNGDNARLRDGPRDQGRLAARGLWPGIHLLGSGCVEADILGTAAGYDKERWKS
jgi:hypothetical protein